MADIAPVEAMKTAKEQAKPFGTGYKLIGKDYATPDMIAKVTGKSKYAEDFRAEGMLFCRLALSQMPHGRITRIDASEALAVPGVKAVLTADDIPVQADYLDDNGRTIKASKWGERALTNEPVYQGEPIFAVAAVDELTCAEAIEKVKLEIDPLPFVIDPLDSLRPGGPNPREDGNVWVRPAAPAPPTPTLTSMKWTDADFADYDKGELPMGEAPDTWKYGDIDAGFKSAALILDESFVTPDVSHQCLEPRTAMAYWQNGKLYLHTGTQSTFQTVPAIARWMNMKTDDIVFISEYTGGGFGSKITGGITMIIPALLSRKLNAPVMMRISREEEHYIGRARPSVMGRVKVGFAKDGRITAVDMYTVTNAGSYDASGDGGSAARIVSLLYQPPAMRWRGITVMTNTPPRSAQSAPGGMQGIAIMEPVLSKAARKLGVDQVALRDVNCPEGKAEYSAPNAQGKRNYTTSCFMRDALEKGAELFRWKERVAQPRKNGTKVRGVGVSLSCYVGGTIGFDGLIVVTPEGRVRFHSGIGNLGTESVMDVHRAGAELLGIPWEACDVVWGDTSRIMPFTCVSGGSQTTHAMSRAAYAVATECKQKLKEVAAKTHGGSPEDYDLDAGIIVNKKGGTGMTLAAAAQKAVELGGIYDGHEAPADVHKQTKAAVAALAGQGLVVAAKDNYPRDGDTYSFVASFAEVEADVETGKYVITDFLAYGDVGTVLHPHSLGGQMLGRSVLGIGHAIGQKWVLDPEYGITVAKRFYQNKPPTILDVPVDMQWGALNIPDPETPVGARGVGEPPVGGGCASILNALTDALGDEIFQRAPVNADTILASLEAGKPMQHPLTASI
jgi:xanthine dehydrogenase molybdenum-binding subunit